MVWIQGLRSTTPGSNELQPCKLVSSNNGEVEDVVAEAVGFSGVTVFKNTRCSPSRTRNVQRDGQTRFVWMANQGPPKSRSQSDSYCMQRQSNCHKSLPELYLKRLEPKWPHRQGAARDCNQKFTARDCKHRQVHFCVCHVLRPVSTFAREREQKKRKINWPVRLSNQAICYWSLHSHSLRKQLNSAPMPELIVHASPRKSNHWSLVVNRNRNFGRMVLVPALALVAHAGCAYALYTVPLCRNSLFTPSPRKSNHWLLDVNL